MPAHAQRMSSLLALDKEFADCRVEGRACDEGGGVQAGRRESRARVGQWRSQARRARGEDPRLEGCGNRARAAERT